MPALTNDRLTPRHEPGLVRLPVKANTTIYAGAIVTIDTATGVATPASNTAGLVVVGVATERAVGGATDGAVNITVEYGRAYKFNPVGAVNNTHIGRVAYIVSDNEVQATPTTNRIKAGKIVGVDPDGVWVYIPYPGASTGAPTSTIDATYDTNESGVLSALRDQHNNYNI